MMNHNQFLICESVAKVITPIFTKGPSKKFVFSLIRHFRKNSGMSHKHAAFQIVWVISLVFRKNY